MYTVYYTPPRRARLEPGMSGVIRYHYTFAAGSRLPGISVPEHVIARERTAEEWDAKTAEVTPVTALKPVVVPRPQKAQHETKAAIVKEKP